jgi:hypothetical protein
MLKERRKITSSLESVCIPDFQREKATIRCRGKGLSLLRKLALPRTKTGREGIKWCQEVRTDRPDGI